MNGALKRTAIEPRPDTRLDSMLTALLDATERMDAEYRANQLASLSYSEKVHGYLLWLWSRVQKGGKTSSSTSRSSNICVEHLHCLCTWLVHPLFIEA